MSKKENIEYISKKKKESRSIVKEIEGFGVTEDQKIDIIYFLTLTLNNNSAVKEICNVVKKYKKDINTVKEESNIKNKLILE